MAFGQCTLFNVIIIMQSYSDGVYTMGLIGQVKNRIIVLTVLTPLLLIGRVQGLCCLILTENAGANRKSYACCVYVIRNGKNLHVGAYRKSDFSSSIAVSLL